VTWSGAGKGGGSLVFTVRDSPDRQGNGQPEMSPSGRNAVGDGPAGKISAAKVFKDGEVRRDGQLMTIVLRDGARFEVDEIWEEPGRIVYRMGSMQGYSGTVGCRLVSADRCSGQSAS
jgi:hypothetical protein